MRLNILGSVGSGMINSPPAEWGLEVSGFASDDLAELVVLQRCCWVAEAIDNNTLAIPALHEDAAAVLAWASTWQVILLRQRGRLVGAVRARRVGRSWEIGRLMVAPDQAGRGMGRWLLSEAERLAPADTVDFVLLTGASSVRNIRMYGRAGYVLSEAPPTDIDHIAGAVFLRKPRAPIREISGPDHQRAVPVEGGTLGH